jgi:hypothetical protein
VSTGILYVPGNVSCDSVLYIGNLFIV